MSFELIFFQDSAQGVFWKLAVTLILFCVNLAWMGVVGLSLQNKAYSASFVAVSQVGYLLFFAGHLFGALGFVGLFAVGCFWLYRAKKDLQNRIKPVVARSLNFGLRLSVGVFLLVVAFGFYWQAKTTVSPKMMLKKIEDIEVIVAEKILASRIKGFDPQMDFESFVHQAAANGLLGGFLVGGREPEQINPSVLEQIRNNYAQRYEIDISLNDSVSTILQNIIHSNLTVVLDKYARFFPFALAIVLFLSLEVISIVYYILIRLFAFGFYHLLVFLGVFKLKKESMEVERVVIE